MEGRPTLGSLLDLCDENYGLLLRLAPELTSMRGEYLSRADDGICLNLEVRSQTPYTSLLQLTHRFSENGAVVDDPAVLLRAYHDARQLEVLELRQQILSLDRRPDHCSLERKWRVNLFLSKWLGYCFRQRFRFASHDRVRSLEAPLCP